MTVPPAAWFHGITRATYELCRDALRELGATLFEVPVDAFLPPDPGRIADLVEDLRGFRPQLAFGLPYLSQALVCRLPAARDGWRPNLFTDLLGVPTLGAWDHAPFELADQLLTPHPPAPAQSRTIGGLLQRTLADERLIHWARDSSQIGLTRRFGLLSTEPLLEMTPALPATRHAPPPPADGPQVAFIGHFYQGAPAHADPALDALAADSIADWLRDGGAMWPALERRLDRLPPEQRRALRLEPDQSFFWAFAHRTVIHDAHSAHRLHVLGAAGVPVACYSNLQADSGVPSNLVPVPGHIPFGPTLDAALARHPITVDVTSPGFGHTISQKLFRGFDAGGFMLVDRKPDFIRAFGDLGEAISYADGTDLAAKIDFYLSNPARRREVGDALRARIALDRRLTDVLRRVIERAAERAPPIRAQPVRAPPAPVRARGGIDVLARLRRPSLFARSRLSGAGHGVTIVTAPPAGSDAAILKLSARRLDFGRLDLGLRVEAGRVAIGLMVEAGAGIVDDRVVSPSRQPVELSFDLPSEAPATIVMRGLSDERCRVVVTYATLHGG